MTACYARVLSKSNDLKILQRHLFVNQLIGISNDICLTEITSVDLSTQNERQMDMAADWEESKQQNKPAANQNTDTH